MLTAVEGQMARGEIPVHVPENGISGLSMPLWSAVTVPGVLHNIGPTSEQSKKAAADDNDAPEFAYVKPGCQIFLKAATGQASFVSMFAPQADTFSIPSVFPGAYRMQFGCQGGYFTSAMFGTNDLLTNPAIMIPPGGTPPPIDVAMKPGGGAIHGRLKVKSAMHQGAVLAVPTSSSSTGCPSCRWDSPMTTTIGNSNWTTWHPEITRYMLSPPRPIGSSTAIRPSCKRSLVEPASTSTTGKPAKSRWKRW